MLKSYKSRLTFCALSADLFLYWLSFRSGITLPFIKPSLEEYHRQFTSFPRNADQMYAWIVAHWPASLIGSFGDRYLVVSVVQTGVIFFVIGALLDRRRARRQLKRTGPA